MSGHYVTNRFPLWKTQMSDKNSDLYTDELIAAAEAAVIGYEKYLLDKLDYRDLSRIMTSLRILLPFDSYDRESE
jgi:hypothetical protein